MKDGAGRVHTWFRAGCSSGQDDFFEQKETKIAKKSEEALIRRIIRFLCFLRCLLLNKIPCTGLFEQKEAKIAKKSEEILIGRIIRFLCFLRCLLLNKTPCTGLFEQKEAKIAKKGENSLAGWFIGLLCFLRYLLLNKVSLPVWQSSPAPSGRVHSALP